MSRLALKTFVAAQLAQLDVPVPVEVFIETPKVTTAGTQIVAVVKDPRETKKRLTLGRPNASKQADHRVQIDLFWVAQDEMGAGIKWDVFLQSVDNLFEQTVTLPQILTDPETGQQSQLVYLAEEIETEVLDTQLVTDADGNALENQVLFAAVKTLTALEIYVG